MRVLYGIFGFVLTLAGAVWAGGEELNLVPWPQSVRLAGGELVLSGGGHIVYGDSILAGLAEVVPLAGR